MGLIGDAFNFISDVSSLGGTYRLRKGREHYDRLLFQYEKLCKLLDECGNSITFLAAQVQKQAETSDKILREIERILSPLTLNHDGQGLSAMASFRDVSNELSSNDQRASVLGDHVPVIAGAGAGVSVAAGAWGAVHLLGHASTGAAIAGLHGAAAANAGWAWFGGGAVAAGGGGMALGHLVLPGIGTAVLVAVSATMSHSKANKLEDLCSELEGANSRNEATLARSSALRSSLASLSKRLDIEGDILMQGFLSARRRLFRFGILSHWWRLLRFRLKGYYYTAEDMRYVDRLAMVADRFVSIFRNS